MDALGLSEIFSIKEAKTDSRREAIFQEILAALNQMAEGSGAQPATSTAWLGRRDIHCMFVWKEDMNMLRSDLILSLIHI